MEREKLQKHVGNKVSAVSNKSLIYEYVFILTLSRLRSRPILNNSICTSAGNLESSSSEPKYCWCRGSEEGAVVACDREQCPFQWFHFECIGIRLGPPPCQWYCPDCQGLSTAKSCQFTLFSAWCNGIY